MGGYGSDSDRTFWGPVGAGHFKYTRKDVWRQATRGERVVVHSDEASSNSGEAIVGLVQKRGHSFEVAIDFSESVRLGDTTIQVSSSIRKDGRRRTNPNASAVGIPLNASRNCERLCSILGMGVVRQLHIAQTSKIYLPAHARRKDALERGLRQSNRSRAGSRKCHTPGV